MSHLEHRNLAMLHAAERLVRECSITEKQAQELISLLGLEWSSLVREARLIVKGATRKVDFRRCKESHLETVCSEARRASDKPRAVAVGSPPNSNPSAWFKKGHPRTS